MGAYGKHGINNSTAPFHSLIVMFCSFNNCRQGDEIIDNIAISQNVVYFINSIMIFLLKAYSPYGNNNYQLSECLLCCNSALSVIQGSY